jgi:hypothetical protein
MRIILVIVGACFFAAAANYYLHIRWFGVHARLVMTSTMLATLVVILVVIKHSSEPSP